MHVAHKVRGDFPDGQLYANLRRADSSPRDPAEVLAALLRELEKTETGPWLQHDLTLLPHEQGETADPPS